MHRNQVVCDLASEHVIDGVFLVAVSGRVQHGPAL